MVGNLSLHSTGSPCYWKTVDWDVNKQTNKQTHIDGK